MIRLVKSKFIIFLFFFLLSCFGPVKEIKYQIEDSFENPNDFSHNPNPLKEIKNNFYIGTDLISVDYYSAGKNFSLAKIEDFIIYGSLEGEVIAINTTNKKIKWEYKHYAQITAGISSDSNKIFFVDYDGYLICLTNTGNIEWKSYVGEVFSKPLTINNSVVVKTTNSKFISLNKDDGSINWNYNFPSSPLPIKSWGEITNYDGVIFSGISSGKILTLKADDGSLIWESTFSQPRGSSEIERSNDTTSKIIVDEFILYAVSSNGNIASLSKKDGELIWSRKLSSFYGMTHDKNNLYVTHNSGSIYAISKINGNVVWRNSNLLGRDVSKGIIFNEYLILSDYEGYLHFISIDDGTIVARKKISSQNLLEPLINSNTIYIQSISGEVFNIFFKTEDFKNNQNNTNKIISDTIDDNLGEDSIFDDLFFWN